VSRRPSWMTIFPQAWVLPGGLVDPGETIEEACVRELVEESGIDIDLEKQNLKSNGEVNVHIEPYYLYESVTKNVTEIAGVDEEFPPKSQHLVLFFLAKLGISHKDLQLKLNPEEIDAAAWVSSDELAGALVEGSKHDLDGVVLHREGSQEECKFSSKLLYPVYRLNPDGQGMGKGHFLACRYLLRNYFKKLV